MPTTNYIESWKDTYKSYMGVVNFSAGDFEELKNAIRNYVVLQTPEGVNDWQSSSEVGIWTNAIAYLGENINFRLDQNIHDVFPSTTTRKQSLLNFTKMLSYVSKRNICAQGIAKLVSVQTTQDVYDSYGNSLKGIKIKWNDRTNDDWMEQFLTVLNSSFLYTNQFGKPNKSISIGNISTQLYQLNNMVNMSAVYSFNSNINGSSIPFDVVNPTIDFSNNVIVENVPTPEYNFNILYRNDGAGNSSDNTGFFLYWKQGNLYNQEYIFDEKIENNFIEVDTDNINDTDVWFQKINEEYGYVSENWTKINASQYLSYTNVENAVRTIFKVETEENDRIIVKFPDGYFGDIPYGRYKLWYRKSNGNSGLYIKPKDIENVSIQIPYLNNSNSSDSNVYYLTLTFSVANVSHIRQSVPTESLDSIRDRAPSIYTTQDRMVSGQDYNTYPMVIGQNLRVLNSVVRTYAGNSRFIKFTDASGEYSPVNVIGNDGYLYSDDIISRSSVIIGSMEADTIFNKYIEPMLSLKEVSNLYYQNYDGEMIPSIDGMYYYWKPLVHKIIGDGVNTMSGELLMGNTDIDARKSKPVVIDDIFVGDVLCMQEYIVDDFGNDIPSDNVVWATVLNIENNERNENSIISISEVLDVTKKWKIRKGEGKDWSKYNRFVDTIGKDTREQIINYLKNSEYHTTFGITYNSTEHTNPWIIIPFVQGETVDLNDKKQMISSYVVDYDNVIDEIELDKNVLNWFIRVTFDTSLNSWVIDTRLNKIIFGSAKETSFFFNTSNKDISNSGYFLTDDVIKIFGHVNNLNRDYFWKPYDVIRYSDGYVDSQEFCCEAYDSDKDSTIDIPTQLNDIISDKEDIIFLKNENADGGESFLDYNDLYKVYANIADVDKKLASFKGSLWEKTRGNTSGYYYTYHRIKEIVRAGSLSEQDKEEFYMPDFDILTSDGNIIHGYTVKNLNNVPLSFDFVDYIKGYDENNNELYYDDEGKVGYLYYYNSANGLLTEIPETLYEVVKGRKNISFMWKHLPTTNYIIDPCTTNIIDMFVLTNTYYNDVQTWVQNGKKGSFPKAMSAYELKSLFSSLEDKKMISDTMVWHPVTYKLIFGGTADKDTHCIFKVIKQNELVSDNELKQKVIELTDEFFRGLGVGETFYFTQLSTYIENSIPELLKTVLIVPTDTSTKFGNLFQISCNENQILISSATIDDVQIISNITEQNIRMI